MAMVIKTIKGNSYLYFQNSTKIDGKTKVITTCIGREDTDPQELENIKLNAFAKHLFSILKAKKKVKSLPYRFENLPTHSKLYTNNMEILKLIYDQIISNLTPEDLHEFEQVLFIRYVHGTTTIEGNTLTEEEAHTLLTTGLSPQNKTLNELLEVANYNDVKNFVDKYKGPITQNLIKQIHRLLTKGLVGSNGLPINAGKYRTSQVILRNIDFTPAKADMVPTRMKYLLAEYDSNLEKNMHPIEAATLFHQKFEEIHPFQDGNGRTGRELLNLMLKNYEYPLIYIPPQEISKYLTALKKGNSENYGPLIEFILGRIAATIQYLYSNTAYYKELTSEKTKEKAKEMGVEDVYDKLIIVTNYYKKSVTVP